MTTAPVTLKHKLATVQNEKHTLTRLALFFPVMIHDNAHDHPEQQLQQTATRLQVALGYTADQVSALPSPALKIQELEQENARLQRENEELRRLLELYSRTNVTYRITLDQNRTWWSSYPGSDEPSEIGIDFDFQDSSWRRTWFVKEIHRFNKYIVITII